MRTTKDYDYNIVTCCGDPVKTVRFRIPIDDDPRQHEHLAMKKGGIANYKCGSCYDWAYHVKYQHPSRHSGTICYVR